MIGEVVSVGTELLLGEIVNGNAAVIASRLVATGFDTHYQVTVDDDVERIAAAVGTACDRSDVVVITGGIGPTLDDVTKVALCALAGVPMSRDEEHAARIYERVLARRGSVVPSVLRMADFPAGAEVIPNGNGLALGVVLRHGRATVFCLPGVPDEMELMLDEHVVPRLRELSRGHSVRTATVRTIGLGESEVEDRLAELCASTNPSIAFRIVGPEVHVRITAKADDASRAATAVEQTHAKVMMLLATHVVEDT